MNLQTLFLVPRQLEALPLPSTRLALAPYDQLHYFGLISWRVGAI